jgi:nitrate reductase gamma subunit
MSNLPTWAVWSVVVPLLLLSPVIMLLLAVTIESLIWAAVDAGAPALVLLAAGVSGLLMLRRLRLASRRAASSET